MLNSLIGKNKKSGNKVNMKALEKFYVDYIYDSVVFYDDLAKQAINRNHKHVLLLHANDLNALYLDKIILRLKKEGWKIISPVEALSDLNSYIVEPNIDNNTSANIRLGIAINTSTERLRNWSSQRLSIAAANPRAPPIKNERIVVSTAIPTVFLVP